MDQTYMVIVVIYISYAMVVKLLDCTFNISFFVFKVPLDVVMDVD
jgi:hypothetical protein